MKFEGFRVRRLDFSLKYREIRPLAVVGTRRKAALRGGTYAWAGFREFPQTPRGRGFSLLGFYSLFKYFVDA